MQTRTYIVEFKLIEEYKIYVEVPQGTNRSGAFGLFCIAATAIDGRQHRRQRHHDAHQGERSGIRVAVFEQQLWAENKQHHERRHHHGTPPEQLQEPGGRFCWPPILNVGYATPRPKSATMPLGWYHQSR
jgi:hypothetical protein